MESLDDKILKSLMKRGKGCVFSTEEYAHYGDPDAVQKALSLWFKKGCCCMSATEFTAIRKWRVQE